MRRPLLSALAILGLLSGLAGCDMVVLSPSGYVAAQQSDMLVTSTSADADHHHPGDGADHLLRLALQARAQERATIPTGTIRPAWSW